MSTNLPSQTFSKNTRGLGIDTLWIVVILAGFGFIISLTPLVSNDFWWHLKIGELIFTRGNIPDTNLFSWSLDENTPFVYGAWLGEYLFYLIYRVGNLELVIFTRNILILLTFWLVGVEAKRRSNSWRIAALVTAPACILTLNNLIVRPQNWSWLPFMAFYILLSRFTNREIQNRWLLTLPIIMIFWVNTHGAFILGLVLVGVFFIGELIRGWIRQPGKLPIRSVAWIGGIGVLSTIATIINPQFIKIFTYVLDLMTDKPSQGLIEEWQSPTPHGIANTMFYIIIIIMFVVFIYSRYRPTPTEILLIMGFMWLAWSGQRYVVWFGLITMPILAKAIADLPFKKLIFEAKKNLVNVLIAGLLFVPLIIVQPWFVERLPLPAMYQQIVWHSIPDGPLVDKDTPVKAVEYLKDHPGGKIYNEMGFGSYLIWKLPEQKVFIDPRVELYPYEQWQDYIHINRGIRYNKLLDHYGADRILLHPEKQKELVKSLEEDPIWQQEYEDEQAQVWKKLSNR
ncbi:MAG: hypothetical protein JXC36_06590 [Candidatus Atribacteria bacterium]|nr:hypothetical protein [Candidatus Atribacteria bacterium]